MVTVPSKEKSAADMVLEGRLARKGYVGLDKSWTIRMGVLDAINGYPDIVTKLNDFHNRGALNEDLRSLYSASLAWLTGDKDDKIYVGESGTLFRFLRFASWKLKEDRQFVMDGTLVRRDICSNPEIINWPQTELLKLDNGTSQWASAAVLMGDRQRLHDAPPKLQLTYEAVEHWNECRQANRTWQLRYDTTLLRQAAAFIKLIRTGSMEFEPEQAEDYCFARAFNLITAEEGERRWPQLAKHETDRLVEMEIALERASKEKVVQSDDHRVMQAVTMREKGLGWHIDSGGSANGGWGLIPGASSISDVAKVVNPKAVRKSWPEFWRFMHDATEIARTMD